MIVSVRARTKRRHTRNHAWLAKIYTRIVHANQTNRAIVFAVSGARARACSQEGEIKCWRTILRGALGGAFCKNLLAYNARACVSSEAAR